jgi:hypothetical protein
MASKAGRVWHDPTSVGRKPRRAEELATSFQADRAGFEPRRESSYPHEYARSKRSALNDPPQMPTARSGSNPARSQRLEIAVRWARRDFRPTGREHLT